MKGCFLADEYRLRTCDDRLHVGATVRQSLVSAQSIEEAEKQRVEEIQVEDCVWHWDISGLPPLKLESVPCLFESLYVALYREKEALEAKQTALDAELATLRSAVETQTQRKSRLQETESGLERREIDTREEHKAIVLSGKAILSDGNYAADLKVKAEKLRTDTEETGKHIEVERKKGQQAAAELSSAEEILADKQKILSALSQKMKEASQRLSSLESQKFDMELEVDSQSATHSSVISAIAAIEEDIDSLRKCVSAPESAAVPDLTSELETLAEQLAQEERRQLSLQAALSDCKLALATVTSAQRDTHEKKLELTQLLSKVQASLLLHSRGISESKTVLQTLNAQKGISEEKEKQLSIRKRQAEGRKAALENEMNTIESQCDSLQSRLSACVRREKVTADAKRTQWKLLKTLKEDKDRQKREFQALKQLKHDVIIEEIRVEELENRVKSLREEVKRRREIVDKVAEVTDPDTLLQQLTSEDAQWERQYLQDQARLQKKAAQLQEREAALA